MQKCKYCGAIIPVGKRECEKCGVSSMTAKPLGPNQKRCEKCGAVIAKSAVFCTVCKSDISRNSQSDNGPKRCPKCGFPLMEDAKFCNKCGLEVKAEPTEQGFFGGSKRADVDIDISNADKVPYSMVSGWKHAQIFTLTYIEPAYVYDCFKKLTAKYRNFQSSLWSSGSIRINSSYFDARLNRTERPGKCIYEFMFTRVEKKGLLPIDFVSMKMVYTTVAKMFMTLDPNTTVKSEEMSFTTYKSNE